MNIDAQARAAIAGGQALALDIETAIREIVITNAATIERFHERREELTRVNSRFLFFYATSLILLFGSGAQRWTEADIKEVIDKAAEEIDRVMRFRSEEETDPRGERSVVAGQLQGMFENVRSNFGRLGELSRDAEGDKAVLVLLLMYLRKVHPASLTLLAEGQVPVVTALQQRFGLISISAHRYLSGGEE